MSKILLLLGISFVSAYSNAWSMPSQIVMIRHGEKPSSGSDLSPQGYERAKALVKFLSTNHTVTHNGPISAIFAASPSKDDGSLRSIETVTPFSEEVNLPIHHDFSKNQVSELVAQIKNDSSLDGKTVLICFEHNAIPAIAQSFGVTQALDWNGNSFDRAWILTFANSAVQFQDIPEDVLPGDSTH